MKKKIILVICLYILPFFAFAEEENESPQQEVSQEISENTKQDEVAINLPSQEELKNDLNSSETPSTNLPPTINDTFPIETTAGYNLENADSNYFLQAEGTDILNESKTRKINFLIKVPYYQIKDSSNKVGVIPDKFCFNFIDPFLNLALGDNKYNLSSLTIKDLEKRGGFLNLNYKDKIGLSSIYLLSKPTKDKNPSDNLGASIFIKPFSFIKLSSNFLYSKFEKEKFSIPINNYTYSLRSTFLINDKNKIDLETATTNKLDKKHLAYLANLDGTNKYFSYLINWFYANPNFIGYYFDKNINTYSDKTKLDGFIKYELNKFVAKLIHTYENNNLDRLPSKENAKRSISSELNFSYPILNPINTTLGVKTKEAKNLLNRDGFKLDAINLNIFIPIKKFCIDNNIELGKYKSRIEDYFSRDWLGYKLFLKYNPTDTSGFSIYTKFGNLLYEDIFTKSYVFGTDLKIKTLKSLDLTFAYEYSTNFRKTTYVLKDKKPKWKGHYFKQDLTYIFSNQHKITLSSHWNKPLEEKKEKAFLLTYTIPLYVPSVSRAFDTIKTSFF